MQGWLTLLILVSALTCSFVLQATELPVKSFSRLPQFSNPELSPNGSRVAFVQNVDEAGLAVLTAFDLSTGKSNYLVQSDNEKVKINWFEWANEQTLLVSVRYAAQRYGTDTTETRLVAIDANGTMEDPRVLIKPRPGGLRDDHISQFQDNVIDFLPKDPEHILIAVDLDIQNMPSVYKLNVNNGKKKRIEKGKRMIRDWMTDQQHRLRLGYVTEYKTGEKSILVRQDEDSDFERMFEYNTLTDQPVYPVGFDLDPNILYFKQYKDDKLALFKLDLTTKEQELVFADPDFDVDGGLIYSSKSGEVIGINHANTDTGRIYWDKNREKLLRSLNKVLPDTDNYLTAFSQDENIYLLYSENDYLPGVYYLGNRKEGSLSILFETYPELVPEVLTEHDYISYKARDGVEIKGYLTIPKTGEAPFPTIIHPHGGPYARDSTGFDYWTSFFANRGYAVLRPNFRGSKGYGYAFKQSQMKRWGLEMQDDLEDGLNWMVEKGYADASKVCIVGGSYGGYAALMGVAKTPDVYKCAISFAGVTNLKTLVSDSRDYVNTKMVKNQIGDDRGDLADRSPYYNVEAIKSPILLIHGEKDRVVDVKHSRMMANELDDEDKAFEYIELENGDHYLSIQRNRHITFAAMDKFLRQHLK